MIAYAERVGRRVSERRIARTLYKLLVKKRDETPAVQGCGAELVMEATTGS